MEEGRPSRTAMAAAMHRAAHQLQEGGRIFADPLAVPIIGAEGAAYLEAWGTTPHRRGMRLFIAARHRLAADRLATALAAGVRQIVVVGAGLDTTALRSLDAYESVHSYEVDHPATQAWKRERLAEIGVTPPSALTYVPVDFERQDFGEELHASGFDRAAPAFFLWLGVVPYLTEAAIFKTLGFVAAVPRAEIVFDYANPPEQLEPALRAAHQRRAAKVAAIGEPWLSSFDSATLAGRLRALGAVEIDDFGPPEIQLHVFGNIDPPWARKGGHVIWVRWP